MSKCEICGSYAINHHCHGRDGSDGDLCDVCYWRKRAEQQPHRQPLTDMQKMMCWSRATHDADVWHKTEHQRLMDYGAEIEAAHNIK